MNRPNNIIDLDFKELIPEELTENSQYFFQVLGKTIQILSKTPKMVEVFTSYQHKSYTDLIYFRLRIEFK